MSKVHISRKHDLDQQQCRAVAQDLLDQLVSKYGGRIKPDGDNYCYRHATGMSAVVAPKEGELDISVRLNMMTRSFAPEIEKQINRALDKHVGKA